MFPKVTLSKTLFFLFVTLFLMTSWQIVAVAQAISVTQGETVTLTLNLVNVGDVALQKVHVQLDPQATPDWIQPEVRTDQTVDVPAKSAGNARPSAMLPFTFTVNRQAPVNDEMSLPLRIRDGQGDVWTKIVRLKVIPWPKPGESQLLQNYPNPFNPETWMPFQLSESSDVSIRIYDASGRLVRTLNLGHKAPGFYETRSAAAYWDGHNDRGEWVGSGIYFYQLITDGTSSAVRKMVIIN
jgi:hypothetical protein